VTLRPGHPGFEGRTRDPERRAFFDLQKRIAELEGIVTSGAPWDFLGTIPTPGPPTDTQDPLPHDDGDMWIDSNGDGWVWNGDAWINVGSVQGPAGPPGPPGPPGETGAQGPPGQDGTGTGTGTDEVWIGPDDPIVLHPTIELWVDSDDDSGGSGGGGGTGGAVAYVHNQGTVAASWLIEHNLSFFPNVTVIDSSGATCEGDVAHIDNDTLTIQFSGGFTGTAYLS